MRNFITKHQTILYGFLPVIFFSIFLLNNTLIIIYLATVFSIYLFYDKFIKVNKTWKGFIYAGLILSLYMFIDHSVSGVKLSLYSAFVLTIWCTLDGILSIFNIWCLYTVSSGEITKQVRAWSVDGACVKFIKKYNPTFLGEIMSCWKEGDPEEEEVYVLTTRILKKMKCNIKNEDE